MDLEVTDGNGIEGPRIEAAPEAFVNMAWLSILKALRLGGRR